jgi:uncharacterized protein
VAEGARGRGEEGGVITMILSRLLIAAVQAASAAPPPVVTVPANSAPSAAPVDPARLAKAEQLLDLIHINQQYDSIFARMTPLMTTQVFTSLRDDVKVPASVRAKLADPGQLAAAERVFSEETTKGFQERYPALRLATAREYAAAFTVAELDQLADFYRSPVGQKSLQVLPSLQAKLMPIGMQAGAEVGRAAMLRTFERLDLAPKAPGA